MRFSYRMGWDAGGKVPPPRQNPYYSDFLLGVNKRNSSMITLHTNYGDIKLELDFDKAPKTAANFVEYVKAGFYDGTVFHRVIDNFMIQGGGFAKA
jgi:hypothetical protein